MKCYTVDGETIKNYIQVYNDPYPHVALGNGGNKRATWIPVGKRDFGIIEKIGDSKQVAHVITDANVIIVGEKKTKLIVKDNAAANNNVMVLWKVESGYRGGAGIQTTLTPQRNADGIIPYVAEGDRETVPGVQLTAKDDAYHSGQGSLGLTAEALMILSPGASVEAGRSGRRVQTDRARLTWDGSELKVLYYSSGADPEIDY